MYASNDILEITKLWKNRENYFHNWDFWKSTLNAMQDTSNVDAAALAAEGEFSGCNEAFESYTVIYDTLMEETANSVSYYKGLASKGTGSGSEVGFFMSKLASYNSVMVAGFGLYNDCNLDYYNQAIGFNTQSVAGLLNFGTNVFYRVTSDETTVADLLQAITDDDTEAIGTNFGIYLRDLLAVEIPNTNSAGLDNYEVATQ